MAWSVPFTAVPLVTTITASGWNTSGRDNLNHLRALLPDPGAANRLLATVTGNSAAFSNPSGDAAFTSGSLTGNGAGSAIGTQAINPNRLVADSFDAATVASVFAAGAIAETYLASAVQDKLIFAGLIGLVRTSAEIPSGWTAESNLAGRIPIGADTTFNEATDYGSSWAHDHGLNGHQHSVSGTVNATGTAATTPKGPDTWPTASQGHTHTYSNSSLGDSSTASSTSWQIPVRAYHYVRRS